MNSRFKFVQSVNPQPIPTNTVKPKFGKLTLGISKFMTIESVNEQKDPNVQATQTVTCTTTTTTTMTKVLNEPPTETENAELPCAQQQKLLLYESTKDGNQSDILTDDDTGSLCSSIDSKELEAGLKEISQPTQNTVANIDRIDTQMQNLSFISPHNRGNVTAKSDDSMHNVSRQLHQLSLQHNQSQHDNSEEKSAKSVKGFLSCSVQTLSSNDTLDREPIQSEHTEEKSDSNSVIVLSDSDTDEIDDVEIAPPKRNISQEPPLKPTMASSNDPGMYNLSSIDQSTMQKVNNFFDNAPFIEPIQQMEQSFNSSHLSKSTKDDVFVPETTDEESINDDSIVNSSINRGNIPVQQSVSEPKEQQVQVDVAVEQDKPNFSDNNIIVDIPVIKSTSDQPRQLIRSQSGVRLTASHSSPIIKNASAIIDSDGIKRTSSNVILKTPGNCGFRFNSNNGQVNIAANIKINIQIMEDSSEESSEDNNKPPRKSQAIQSSEECSNNVDVNTNTNTHDSYAAALPKISQLKSQNDSKNTQTPERNTKSDAVNTPTRTPQTASKLKQFEFVPPKSMTKSKKVNTDQGTENEPRETKAKDKSMTSESSENDGFQVDKSIPISPRDQKLLHKVYGDAWKTPDVIRSYSAVKGKPIDRAPVNTTPSVLKDNRYSKGFDLFTQKLKTNLNSTRLDDLAEISIIESPKRAKEIKSPKTGMKPPQNTPRSKVKPVFTARKLMEKDMPQASPSILTKKKPSPKSSKKQILSPEASVIGPRPQRNVRRKKIIYSDDESDKENIESDWSDDSCNSVSELLTEDESDEEVVTKPRSFQGKKTTAAGTSKRSTKKSNKDKLVFLDLSSEEIAEVAENFHANVSEEDLANITRKFLETDLNEKPKKKTGRKLFTQQYDEIEEETQYEPQTPRSVKKKPEDEPSLDIEIPRFTHKLFDSKRFGSPSLNKTPTSKTDIKIDEFKTPTISKILAERRTPSSSVKSKLYSPPKTFDTYGFLKSLDVQASMMLCHPDAKKFRENFKSHKEELTTILYKLFNEKVFDNKLNVDIIWNKKLTTTAGRFHGKKMPIKLNGNHRIELSEKVLTSADRLRCTLIHELCHAATWIFDNEKGHGARWKSWAKKANQVFPELPTISVCHNYDIEYKYTYKCDMCHSKSYSHSKSRKVENIRCSYCHGMISIFLNKKKDGKIVMEPVREATGFAKFVKEKYKEFKKPGVKHAEVMRQISSQYSMLSQEEKKQY